MGYRGVFLLPVRKRTALCAQNTVLQKTPPKRGLKIGWNYSNTLGGGREPSAGKCSSGAGTCACDAEAEKSSSRAESGCSSEAISVSEDWAEAEGKGDKFNSSTFSSAVPSSGSEAKGSSSSAGTAAGADERGSEAEEAVSSRSAYAPEGFHHAGGLPAQAQKQTDKNKTETNLIYLYYTCFPIFFAIRRSSRAWR